MSQNETLKIQKDTDNIVEFLYDSPKTGTNNYGDWYLYGVMHEGAEKAIFATKYLNDKLQYYSKGDRVNIRKEASEDGKTIWSVVAEGDTKTKNEGNTTLGIDARTHDIHKQVCLKLAVDMMDKGNTVLTEGELVVIEANMKALLQVLEGTPDTHTIKDEEKLPF